LGIPSIDGIDVGVLSELIGFFIPARDQSAFIIPFGDGGEFLVELAHDGFILRCVAEEDTEFFIHNGLRRRDESLTELYTGFEEFARGEDGYFSEWTQHL
jgi:hypothetical protein